MSFLRMVFGVTAALAWLRGAYAKLDLNATDNVVVYWGQNSVEATGDGEQERLSYYCKDDKIDAVVMAFVTTIHGRGSAPEIDLGNISHDCDTIPGTALKKCPKMEDDINACKQNNKTVIISVGGATYSEGGFSSEDDAKAGADMIWKTFGPMEENGPAETSDSAPHTSFVTSVKPQPTSGNQQSYNQPANNQEANGYGNQKANGYGNQGAYSYGNQGANGWGNEGANGNQWGGIYGRSLDVRASTTETYRPFGNASVDGIDLDFEATNTNMGAFANRLRELMDAESDKKYYLTAAPQCPYPDAADKDFLNGKDAAYMDAIFVQFYNNPCGLDAFKPNADKQDNFNFATWDDWAQNDSKNKDVKVLLGVPSSKGAAHRGFIPASDLKPVIEYAERFDSFGGVMMWDVSQAYANEGFLGSVSDDLDSVSSSSSRSLSAQTLAPNVNMVLGVALMGCLYLVV